MRSDRIFLHFFNVLARFVGAVWSLGGLFLMLISFLYPDRRWVYQIVGSFFLAAGIGLIVAKRATAEDADKMRQRFLANSR